MISIYNHGSEDIKSYWLPKLSSGKTIGAYGIAEPHSGFSKYMETSAIDMGDHYLLNGHKRIICFASVADIFLILAK